MNLLVVWDGDSICSFIWLGVGEEEQLKEREEGFEKYEMLSVWEKLEKELGESILIEVIDNNRNEVFYFVIVFVVFCFMMYLKKI